MKESYGEGLASHTDPESCGACREGGVEALTGARTGRVLSRENISLRDADAVEVCGRHHWAHRYREMRPGPARSETPGTYGRTSRGSREIPWSSTADGAVERVGKFKDVRRR
jgi:RNA-directed DNA polymerase